MEIFKCPKCGKEISDKTSVCIHCSYSLKVNNNIYFLYAPMWNMDNTLRKLLREVLGYTNDEIKILESKRFRINIANNLTIEQAKAISEVFLGNDYQIYLNKGGGSEDVVFWKELGITLNKNIPKEYYFDEPLVSREQLADLAIPKKLRKPKITQSNVTQSVVKCPECGSFVNDGLIACTICGFPLKEKYKSTDIISITAENVDKALEKARELFDVDSLSNVEYEIIQMNKKSIFGKKPAIIQVRCKEEM